MYAIRSYYVVAYLGAVLIAGVFDASTFPHRHGGLFSGLLGLAAFLPSTAVAARRLHDTGRSGWWQLLWLIPLFGQLILIFWWSQRGEPGSYNFV